MRKIREVLGKYYPPGYDVTVEWWGIGLLWGMGFFFSLLQFFYRLARAERRTYKYRGGELVLAGGSLAEPFASLAEGIWMFFLPLAIFTVFMIFYHYLYYFRETKSIYLMRRLPRRELIWENCIQAPACCLAAEALSVGLTYLLYYGAYRLALWRIVSQLGEYASGWEIRF
ncbi:MAG: hypothetical protein NC432_08250 [Roseburia sp.]|nr:hypothetical protein [Roseburia sp.]MCM1098679.1 hypothetical protein [Ruminococcus flavefaciens]